jgi:ribosomal protein L12E/L44/L45/RPP1/RPP2
VESLSSDLSEIRAALKKIAERPFAPAPEPKEKPVEEKEPEKKEEAKAEAPKERTHRFGSRRWFGDRAYED